MGANIGTTITSWMLSLTGIEGSTIWLKLLKPSSFSPILAAIGIVLVMVSKGESKLIELTYKEYELLSLFILNKGIVLNRDTIMDQVWGTDYEGESRTIDMHVKTLRQKLGDYGTRIKTVRNVGYVIE